MSSSGFDITDLLRGLDAAAARERVAALVASAVPVAAERPGVAQVDTVDAFTAVDEPGAEPLLGTDEQVLIPVGGDAMIYGDGGTGKTTLVVDLAFHLAAGDDWVGIPVDEPRVVLLIESEGPRPLFRKKLLRRSEAWEGSGLEGRLLVLSSPWGKLRFTDENDREMLADVIREHGIDVVIAGPVVQLGMDEAGTMQQVREFVRLVGDARRLSGRKVTFVLVHHENKGGKVSGAWEGAGDALFHVQGVGAGKLRLFVQKARWASQWHRQKLNLVWARGESFELTDAPVDRPERTWDDLNRYVLEHGGCKWGEVRDAVQGNNDYLGRRRDQALEDGLWINAGTGRQYLLWHRDDPARPTRIDDETEDDDDDW